jgi:hypothetical protein
MSAAELIEDIARGSSLWGVANRFDVVSEFAGNAELPDTLGTGGDASPTKDMTTSMFLEDGLAFG